MMLHFRAGYAVYLSLLGLGFIGTQTAHAQFATGGEPGQVPTTTIAIEPESANPFTETWDQIQARNNRYIEEIRLGTRRPKPLRPVENGFEEKMERELERAWGFDRPGPIDLTRYAPTPFRARSPFTGSMVPTLPLSTLKESGPRAPQTAAFAFTGPALHDIATTFSTGSIPPDTQGAVGPNHIMVSCNGILATYNKSTGARIGNFVDPDVFFTVGATAPINGSFDPRVLYDKQSERWFLTSMETGATSASLPGKNGRVMLAVSRTSDPTGTWDKYFIPCNKPDSGGVEFFTDYSTLGVDANGVYFAARHFSSTGPSSVRLYATPKSTLIAASPTLSTVTATADLTDMGGTPHPALNWDNSGGGRCWFVASGNTSGDLRLRNVTWSGATPTFSSLIQVTTGMASIASPPNLSASGSAVAVDTGDTRLMAAILRNNTLWTSRTIGVNSTGVSTGADRAASEWVALNVTTATPTVTQRGRIFDNAAATPASYFYPTVAVNGQGHAAISFAGGTSTTFVGNFTSGRLASDPLSTTQGLLTLQAGLSSYSVTFGGPDNRWGDYSYVAIDPSDDQTLWSIHQYAENKPTGSATIGWGGNWAIRVARLRSLAPTATATAVTALPGQTNVSLPITGTNLFDPGSAFPSRLTASASGTGISNVRVAYISPTAASVTFNVANTATAGTRNVTLTNPDGQSVTINNAITVAATQPVLAFSRTITNTGSAWRVALTITNSGGSSATSVRVLTSRLGSTNTSTATPISVGTIAAGGSAVVNIDFPLAAATSGTAVIHRVTGDYAGNTFSSAARITP